MMSGYDAELAQLTEESSDCSETQAPVRRTLTLRKAAGLAVVGILGLAALGVATSGKAGALSYKAAAVVDLAEKAEKENLFSRVVAQEAEVKKEEAALEVDIKKAKKAIAEDMKKIAEDKKDPKKLPFFAEDKKKMKEMQELKDALMKEFEVHTQLESIKVAEEKARAAAASDKKAMIASADMEASLAKAKAESKKISAAEKRIVGGETANLSGDQNQKIKTLDVGVGGTINFN